jgi:hypothetical protein
MKKNTAAWARDLARKHLEIPLPRRWAHTQGVARQARTLAPILGDKADRLEAAAWLHDIGYAPGLVYTGFHPLDGARYLRDTHHADDSLCRMVANHSYAIVEARLRGLGDDLTTEFPALDAHTENYLTYCDMTTTPTGGQTSTVDRLSEIRERYGPDNIVTEFVNIAALDLLKATQEVTQEVTCDETRRHLNQSHPNLR